MKDVARGESADTHHRALKGDDRVGEVRGVRELQNVCRKLRALRNTRRDEANRRRCVVEKLKYSGDNGRRRRQSLGRIGDGP